MCKPNLNSIMLFFGRNALTFGRGTACSLSIFSLWGQGHNKLESFGFWRRKFCIKNAEIFAVGKIAEFAKFAGEKDESLQTAFPYTSWPKAGMLLAGGFLTLYRSAANAKRI